MRHRNQIRILALVSLGLMLLPAVLPTDVTGPKNPVLASYNPGPASKFHSPLSAMGLVELTNATLGLQSQGSSSNSPAAASGLQTIRQNALRFINDTSYFPQSETTIAVDPSNPSHVVGGFNDAKYFLCRILPADCTRPRSASLSGFTTSTDGGLTVAKSSNLPDISFQGTFLASLGDPSLAPTVDGNFFYASLAANPSGSFYGNGIMIAESNSNLFNAAVSCVTSMTSPTFNACWKATLVFGDTGFPVFTLEDKDRITVDRNPASQFYGSVYVAWDHFSPIGLSSSYLARCDRDLNSCTLVSGGTEPLLSGSDLFVAWTTPVTDKTGNVFVSWCNFGTFTTFGPVICRISGSSPGGSAFGPSSDIVSYMGGGTTLPSATVILGWATEQFRVATGIISIASDLSGKSDNLYFTTQVCTSGHYYAVQPPFPVADDNPGDCGTSSVLLSKSSDGGATWSAPTILSHLAVNDQAYVTVDPQTGNVYDVYYTTQFDDFNHRIDVVASTSSNLGLTFHQKRVTSVSDEPSADPNMFAYLIGNGFGGSFIVPQYGDYFEATARAGTLWVLFTGNYAVEAGTFQTDPFLAVLSASVSI